MGLLSSLFGGGEGGADVTPDGYPTRGAGLEPWELPRPTAVLGCEGCGEPLTVPHDRLGDMIECEHCGTEKYARVAMSLSQLKHFECPWCNSTDTTVKDYRPEDRSVSCNDCDFRWQLDQW